jgi:hypothetical protein
MRCREISRKYIKRLRSMRTCVVVLEKWYKMVFEKVMLGLKKLQGRF